MLRTFFFGVVICLCYLSSVGLTTRLAASDIKPSSATPVTLDGILDKDNDDTLAFTPDGNTVFFDRTSGPHKTIMISHRVNGRWSQPQTASFSGQWFDQDPVVAPDGSFLLFNSNCPTSPGGKPLIENYFGGGQPGPGANIWRVDLNRDELKGNKFGEPVWLSSTINSDVFIDFASIAADGTLYFMKFDNATKTMHLWRSRFKNGEYLAPEFVTLDDPTQSIHDPAVAPDESFIVFDYGKVKGGLGRLSLAFREGDHWGKRIDLGDDLNKDLPWGSHLAPDAHTIYFTGNSGIQKFSLEPWLDAHSK